MEKSCKICGSCEDVRYIPIYKGGFGKGQVHYDGAVYICKECLSKCEICSNCNKPIMTSDIENLIKADDWKCGLFCNCAEKNKTKQDNKPVNYLVEGIISDAEFAKSVANDARIVKIVADGMCQDSDCSEHDYEVFKQTIKNISEAPQDGDNNSEKDDMNYRLVLSFGILSFIIFSILYGEEWIADSTILGFILQNSIASMLTGIIFERVFSKF